MTIDLFVDESGCVHLPEEVMTALGVLPGSHVLLEVTPEGAVLKSYTSLAGRSASINLPVNAWDEMKAEIIAAHLRI